MKMNIKEKLQFFSDNGMSVSFIAKKIGISPSTLNKWLRGEKGITHKNEELVFSTLQKITTEFVKILEE
jgi:transposase-like protein